ncbi:hypothetical protein [Pseudoduganella namucuonensis]|uniref:Uncharacterized protein n=1 Tax=Pseudoduganella namucuonensis TaxID=1035707 RepID=A0A1I7J2Z8_9BURK|nr:hypothetical protein [Pseudoduganella namucuonensis]SFU79578.1 hypothetical protein SAMN05216552_101017 [Pseudoduganella namucuonensis]
MTDKLHNLEQLHEAMRAGLAAKLPDVPTVAHHPAEGAAPALPAILIELARLEPGRDPGSGQAGLRGRFEARIVADAAAPGAGALVRELAARLALAIKDENWGVPAGMAQFAQAAPDTLVEAGRVAWRLEWTQEFELGEPAWPYPDSGGAALMLGLDPDTGPGHEARYWQAGAEPAAAA